MWKQLRNTPSNTYRYLYAVICLVYVLVLSLPITVVSAQENTSVPETTASETQSEAPVPETVNPAPVPAEPVIPEQPIQPPAPEEKEDKYVYNSNTGKWENSKYTWDPNTRQTAPKSQPDYSYNPETTHWDTNDWVYSPQDAKYVAPTQVKPVVVTPKLEVSVKPFQDSLTSKPLSISQPAGISDLRVDQNNSNSYFDLYFDANISTTHSSHAVSGNASVLQNTLAGSAMSGDALAMVNIINMVQSVWGWQGLLPEFYTADIQGDYFGDILINPTQLATTSNCNCQDTLVNNTTNASIENNVDLIAKSGDVIVAGNTEAGDARSGDATAIANIINLINTSMVAGKSFIGNININGSLEGDILMPDKFLDSLVASNIPSIQMNFDNTDINLNSNTDITNNINANATSGEANVSHNTLAGDARTGEAKTNVTIFNLTNRSVVGTNALLVFVNVGGEWAGFITDAPEGATVAMLGGGITSNNCTACNGSDTNANLNSNASITNNINVNSTSGNADVTNNTIAGNAMTGNAVAMANTANISSSSVSLSGWFGVLFINILDNWMGSFGTNTAYGNIPEPTTPTKPPETYSPGTVSPTTFSDNNYRASEGAVSYRTNPNIRTYAVSFAEDNDNKVVLASADEIPTPPIHPNAANVKSTDSSNQDLALVALVTLLASAGVAGVVYRSKLQFLISRLVS